MPNVAQGAVRYYGSAPSSSAGSGLARASERRGRPLSIGSRCEPDVRFGTLAIASSPAAIDVQGRDAALSLVEARGQIRGGLRL